MGSRRIPNTRPRHVSLRNFIPAVAEQTYAVFFNSVRYGTTAYYTAQERATWAASSSLPEYWCRRLEEQNTILAETEDQIVGFMSVTKNGHIDLAFVLPTMMGTGTAD